MKKLSCLGLLGASLLMFSCGDDAPAPVADPYALPGKYSSQSTEANKAALEENGIKLLKSLEGLRDSKGVETSVNLMNLFNSMGQTTTTAPGGRVLSSLSNLRTDSKSASTVFAAMRLQEASAEGSIQTLVNESAGTYAWLSSTNEWDTVARGGSSIIYKFPAVEGGTSNNATLTIGDYQGVNVTIEGTVVELPKNLAMNVVVDGAKVIEYSFAATYNGSSDPTSMVSKLTIAPYTFEANLSNSTTAVETNYSLKNGAEVLMAMGASSTGKYSVEGFNSTNESEIVENASAYFQLFNVKIAGNVDMKSIVAGLDAMETGTLSEQAASQNEADLFNKHYKLVVFYVDSNEKIADTEFYESTHTESYSYPVDKDGDGYYESQETYTYTSSNVDMRFVFADGSKSDFETYFNTGFGKIEAEFETFRASL